MTTTSYLQFIADEIITKLGIENLDIGKMGQISFEEKY